MTVDINLPPLPSPLGIVDPEGTEGMMQYTASDLQDYAKAYALAAIKADRKRRGEPVAWRPIETAPHNAPVLLGWKDWDGAWMAEVSPATWGWRTDSVSNISQHGQATHWMPLPSSPQPAAPALEPGVPECPYPCGWESLHKLAVHDGAYLARALDVGQILTDNQRDTAIVASIRLIEVCRAMLSAAPKFGEEEWNSYFVT